ncbi:MAG: hypothetical protein JRI66_13065 [Deltaproteobacteria bacterium]|nr:hypothetical protein [Deltaproteobacteria bacterium]
MAALGIGTASGSMVGAEDWGPALPPPRHHKGRVKETDAWRMRSLKQKPGDGTPAPGFKYDGQGNFFRNLPE